MWTFKQERRELFGPLSGSGSQFQEAQGKDSTFLGGDYLGPGEARPHRGREKQWTVPKGFVSTSMYLKKATHGKEKWTRVTGEGFRRLGKREV